MARHPENEQEAAEQLWKRLEDTRAGMLWIKGSDQHPQPMSHFADEEAGVIWFITSADTDLVAALGPGAQAGFTYQSQKGDYHASITGPLVAYESDAKIDELWSPPVAAWFEEGREDDKITLLQFTPREAAIWASDANPILVGLKLMRAAMQDGEAEPNIGSHQVINFARVA